jgi:hypothetical protein
MSGPQSSPIVLRRSTLSLKMSIKAWRRSAKPQALHGTYETDSGLS